MTTDIQKRNADQYLTYLLDWYRSQNVLPALGAGLVLGGELVASRATGVRKYGTSSSTEPDDLFHLGSITKPMTGYLVARLVDKNVFSWDCTIGQIYPEIISALENDIGPDNQAWSDHYRNTTIVDLMTHTSGVDYAPRSEKNESYSGFDIPLGSTPNQHLIAKRRLYTQLAVHDQPYAGWSGLSPCPPQKCLLQKYSGGCIIVASMAEQVTGKAWETLMVEQVFQPLEITHYAFNLMSSPATVTNTWQHLPQDGQILSTVDPDQSQIHYTHGPAGAVCLSIRDLGKWVIAILTNSISPLGQAIWEAYVTPPSVPTAHNCSRGGWFSNGHQLNHGGSNGWNQSLVTLDREKQRGAFACTNIGGDQAGHVIGELCADLEGMGDAWEAFGFLHQAVDPTLISVTADSVWDNTGHYAPALVSDRWYHTRWASQINNPTLTATLDRPRMLKGLILCQAIQPHIQTFEIETASAEQGAPPIRLSGPALDAMTTRSANGMVIRTLFDTPTQVKTLTVKIKSASSPPTISRLLVLEYVPTVAKDFDIDLDGHLWVVDAADHVLTTAAPIEQPTIVLEQDTGGIASLVRKAGQPPYVLGSDGKVWKGMPGGWVQIADDVTSKRIAVDAANNTDWSIDTQGKIRRHNGTNWVEHPGGGRGKDLCVQNSTAFLVGMDDYIYQGTSTGWQKLSGASPHMKRIAVDEQSGKLWSLSTTNQIFSYNTTTHSWTEHPGGGRGQAIALHKGVPYVLGMDDGIWKSLGTSGWARLTVLQDKRGHQLANKLTGLVWPSDKAYFFKGARYVRYDRDPVQEGVDQGYPKPIAGSWPGLTGALPDGFDTAVVWPNGRAYFFSGDRYVAYLVDPNNEGVVSGYPKYTALNWAGWPAQWVEGIDAALVWDANTAYFFRGAEYLRYNIPQDHVEPGYPKPIAGNWPGLAEAFPEGIDSAIDWGNGVVYFFRGNSYVRYRKDPAHEGVEAGYPRAIEGLWPGLDRLI